MQNNNQMKCENAGFWIRFAAHMIDFVIVMTAVDILKIALDPVMTLLNETAIGGEIIFHYTLMDIVEYVLVAVYFVVMTYLTGATLGKKVLKLKVVPAKEDEKLDLFTVVYRETIGRYLSDSFLGLGYLVIVFHKEKKAIHDILCDTRVVKVKNTREVQAVKEDISNVDMIPKMVEESVNQSPSQEYVDEQWKMILQPQKEEENIEGNS